MTRQKNYVPTLDGWRALSVVAVVLYHGRDGFFGVGSLLSKICSRGNLGVQVFFAISGFLICGLLMQEHERTGDINLRRFYIRRCFRILPPYYAVLTVIILLSIFGIIRANYSDLPSCLLFYRNYKPLGIDQSGGFYTAHFWSLAVEEQFYLIWPMLLLAFRPKRLARLALLLVAAALAWKALDGHLPQVASMIPLPMKLWAYTDTLLWGCLAAIYFPTIQRRVDRIRFNQLWIPLLAVLLLCLSSHSSALHSLLAILLPALVLSTVLQPESWLARALEWKAVRWIGTLSYSIYLWQELFLPAVGSELARGFFGRLQHWPWNVPAILVCACLSRYLLEIPMNRLGHRLTASSAIAMRPVPAPSLALASLRYFPRSASIQASGTLPKNEAEALRHTGS